MEVSIIFYLWFMGKDQKNERKKRKTFVTYKLGGLNPDG